MRYVEFLVKETLSQSKPMISIPRSLRLSLGHIYRHLHFQQEDAFRMRSKQSSGYQKEVTYIPSLRIP